MARLDDRDIALKRGSAISPQKGEGLHLRKADAKKKIDPLAIADACREGKTLSAIATTFNLAPLTVATTIERLARKGEITTITNLVDPQLTNAIESILEDVNTTSLVTLIKHCPKETTEETLRIVRGAFVFKRSQEY